MFKIKYFYNIKLISHNNAFIKLKENIFAYSTINIQTTKIL